MHCSVSDPSFGNYELRIKVLQTSVHRFFCGPEFSVPLSQGEQLLEQMVRGGSVFQETARVASKVTLPFCIVTGDG